MKDSKDIWGMAIHSSILFGLLYSGGTKEALQKESLPNNPEETQFNSDQSCSVQRPAILNAFLSKFGITAFTIMSEICSLSFQLAWGQWGTQLSNTDAQPFVNMSTLVSYHSRTILCISLVYQLQLQGSYSAHFWQNISCFALQSF